MIRLLSVFFILLACTACTRESPPADEDNATTPQALEPFDAAKQAATLGNWEAAESLVRDALIQDAGNIEVLQLAARIAFERGDPESAADYLADAATGDGYENSSLVQQATIGFVSVGKLYEAIDFLERVVETHPERHEPRRQLFDFLINVEETQRATPHGRKLVRARKFDRVLLFSLGTHEQRDMETNSMAMLSDRNPDDSRLRLAEIRSKFDVGKWEGVEESLLSILEQYPDTVAAQVLLGRYLVETEQFDRLAWWSEFVTEQATETWQYWDILGNLALRQSRYRSAARAFWESTQRNADVAEVFARLASTLAILEADENDIDREMVAAVDRRAQLLARYTQDKERFYKLGNRSNAVARDVALTLLELGRVWEAEAWTAFAMTIPDEAVDEVKEAREKIISQLRRDLPWQVTTGHPAIALDLSDFPKPQFQPLAESGEAYANTSFKHAVVPSLRDRASERGLGMEASSRSAKGDAIPIFAQMESGGCAIDFDLDGWSDLYVARSDGQPAKLNSSPNRLWRNLNGQFRSAGEQAGIGDRGFAQGVTFGDLNEDGFPDLVVLNYGVDRVFLNNGDGTFREGDGWIPKDPTSWSTSAAIADLNGDGLSDLYCARYCAGLEAVKLACHDAETGLESPCLPTQFAAARDHVYAGTERGGFEDVTDQWAAAPLQLGRGLGVVAGQLDSRPGIDLFVANDMTNNHFWSPDATSKSFRLGESSVLAGLAFDARFRPQACMGIATADLDDDGDVDLFVTNFEQEHNTLYEQARPGTWVDRTATRGIRETSFSQLGFGTQAIDFDNDSHLELIIANGHVYRDAEAPSSYAQKMQILGRQDANHFRLV
ncbi:MAG: FG-GAP-like repeat-containing protein, partial [Planctomycetota bacterium]